MHDHGMNGNTFIGLCWNEERAYCKRCNHSFKFGYNSAGRGSGRGDHTCPKCHKHDMVETSGFIEMHIDLLRSFIGSGSTNEDQKKALRKEVNELLRIQRVWLAEREKEDADFMESLKKKQKEEP